MTAGHLIRANFAAVRTELAETFPHLTDDMLEWAPVPGMHTIRRLFMDIMTTEQSILERLRGLPRSTDEELDAPYLSIKTVAGLLEKMAAVRDDTLGYLDTLDEAELAGPSPHWKSWSDGLQLNPTPVSEVLRYIARHEYYHAGQLFTYLWMRGDDPYAWD